MTRWFRMYKRFISRAVPAGLLLLLYAISLPAQDYRGKIEGIVTDQSQGVVPDATVTLRNAGTGVQTVRKTGGNGLYLFDLVDPGNYSLTVEATGFAKFVQERLAVQTRGDVTVNATLTPGTVSQNVTVTDAPSAVEFNSSNKDLTI